MQHINNQSIPKLSRALYQTLDRPIGILQFGEGNFLRTFVDNFIQILNNKKLIEMNIAVVQPMPFGRIEAMAEQDGLYTVFLEGLQDGKVIREHQVIDVVKDLINPYSNLEHYLTYASSRDLKIIFSNTTEAGIVLEKEILSELKTPHSFPGKLLLLLKKRYDVFQGDPTTGLDIVPCELIDQNGTILKEVLNELSKFNGYDAKFIEWLNMHNRFYNTLVDRIVPGYPKEEANHLELELGYQDHSMVKGEIFHLWVIEGPEQLKSLLPFEKSGLHVYYVPSIKPYKERKVKILNGSHTLMVPIATFLGFEAVRESILDERINKFVRGFIDLEVVPTIDLPKDEMKQFAESVLERYANPFVHHLLSSIALNSMSKFKSRILPTIKDLVQQGIFPRHALFSLAAWILYYRGLDGEGQTLKLQDDEKFLVLFKDLWSKNDLRNLVTVVLCDQHWESDVLKRYEMIETVIFWLDIMLNEGMSKALDQFFLGV